VHVRKGTAERPALSFAASSLEWIVSFDFTIGHQENSTNCHASTAQPRSNVITVADCYHDHGRGEDRENAGVKHAEVVTARLVQDERGWLRLAG
jgi:hypothetical protein